MEVCDFCKKDYIPLRNIQGKNKNRYCSGSCRVRLWLEKQKIKQIDSGNYRGLTVGHLERLGYKVEVTKLK